MITPASVVDLDRNGAEGMSEKTLLKFMVKNRFMAKVGKEMTLQSAESLLKKGFVVKCGEYEGRPIFHLTHEALRSLGIEKVD